MSGRVVARLVKVLERERELLISGDLQAAAHLANAKETALERLRSSSATDIEIVRIREIADRNTHLIRAAKQGVEAARLRLRNIAKGVSVNTYSATGARNLIERTEGDLLKRS